jgi:hypothetical protein
MQRYRVMSGPLRLNLGTMVDLSAKQLATRAAKVEVTKKLKDGAVLAHVNQEIEFKTGEEIGLPEELPRRISTLVELVGADAKSAAPPPPPPKPPGKA